MKKRDIFPIRKANVPYAENAGSLVGEKYKAGTEFAFRIAVVGDPTEDLAVIVQHDGLNKAEVAVVKKMYRKGKMPSTLLVGVEPGLMRTTDGTRNMRSNDYDLFDREYGDFIVEELLPHVEKTYGYHLDKDPDRGMTSGGSSGGISAFVLAWYHPERFHRIYMSSPSFLAMGKGDELISLVRKYETRPFRIWMEYSEKEPNEYFGSSYAVALGMEEALKFAGYDMKSKYYASEGHCSRYMKKSTLRKVYSFLWKDYKKAIFPSRNSPRVDAVVDFNSSWEKENGFPNKRVEKTKKGTYTFGNGKVVFVDNDGNQAVFPDDFSSMTSIALSSDHTRLYVADATKGCVWFFPLDEKGYLGKRYVHAMLHLSPVFTVAGAYDICVDGNDRLYAATEPGVQCVRSFGLIDCILSLPGDAVPKRITCAEDGVLFVETDDAVYSRQLKAAGKTDTPSAPKGISYYD